MKKIENLTLRYLVDVDETQQLLPIRWGVIENDNLKILEKKGKNSFPIYIDGRVGSAVKAMLGNSILLQGDIDFKVRKGGTGTMCTHGIFYLHNSVILFAASVVINYLRNNPTELPQDLQNVAL